MRDKIHTTNYYNTFIGIAEDCPVSQAEIPPQKGDKKTVANYHFEILRDNPYKYTSDDLLFEVFAIRHQIEPGHRASEREKFFSKGQPCMRTSPLAKRYGWGIHSDGEGKIALYGVDSQEYRKFSHDPAVMKVKAMRSKRK